MTLSEAHRVWTAKLEIYSDVQNMGNFLDRYAHEVIPLKAPNASVKLSLNTKTEICFW